MTTCKDCRWWVRGYRGDLTYNDETQSYVAVWFDNTSPNHHADGLHSFGDCRYTPPTDHFPRTHEDDWCSIVRMDTP